VETNKGRQPQNTPWADQLVDPLSASCNCCVLRDTPNISITLSEKRKPFDSYSSLFLSPFVVLCRNWLNGHSYHESCNHILHTRQTPSTPSSAHSPREFEYFVPRLNQSGRQEMVGLRQACSVALLCPAKLSRSAVTLPSPDPVGTHQQSTMRSAMPWPP
jgi:hypothetical protein